MRRRKPRRLALNHIRRLHDARGNNTDRANRKRWLLKTFGNGRTVKCVHCKKTLDYDTLTSDRIIPECAGGRYTHGNIQPSCKKCNDSRNFAACGYVPSVEEVAMEKAFRIKRNPRRRRLNLAHRCLRTKRYRRASA